MNKTKIFGIMLLLIFVVSVLSVAVDASLSDRLAQARGGKQIKEQKAQPISATNNFIKNVGGKFCKGGEFLIDYAWISIIIFVILIVLGWFADDLGLPLSFGVFIYCGKFTETFSPNSQNFCLMFDIALFAALILLVIYIKEYVFTPLKQPEFSRADKWLQKIKLYKLKKVIAKAIKKWPLLLVIFGYYTYLYFTITTTKNVGEFTKGVFITLPAGLLIAEIILSAIFDFIFDLIGKEKGGEDGANKGAIFSLLNRIFKFERFKEKTAGDVSQINEARNILKKIRGNILNTYANGFYGAKIKGWNEEGSKDKEESKEHIAYRMIEREFRDAVKTRLSDNPELLAQIEGAIELLAKHKEPFTEEKKK